MSMRKCPDPYTHRAVVSMLRKFPNLRNEEWDLVQSHENRCRATEKLILEKVRAWATAHPELEVYSVQTPPARLA